MKFKNFADWFIGLTDGWKSIIFGLAIIVMLLFSGWTFADIIFNIFPIGLGFVFACFFISICDHAYKDGNIQEIVEEFNRIQEEEAEKE
jgi:hypothetical protein